MNAELEVLLQILASDPEKVRVLAPETELTLLAGLRAAVGSTMPSSSSTPPPAGPAAAWSEDDLLTVNEAAVLLRLSPRWFYRHAKTLPFARKLSRKVLRFSRAGIAGWLAKKRP